MNAIRHAGADAARDAPVPLLRTLVLCDIADSTALVERLGDLHAAELFRRHDRLARTLVHQYRGREIDKTDGFLMMFDRPIEAVAFALAYQRGLAQLDIGRNAERIRARVGVHVGDVVTWDNAPEDVAKGAKPTEVEGLVKPVTSRLMQLALPGQILLSGVAYQLAHRSQDELGDVAATAHWRAHGRYRFKGLPEPTAVYEVGEDGIAPLRAPPWSGKAHREVPFWRRPATIAVEAVVLLAVAAVPLWYLLHPEPAIAFAKRDWIIVGDLKNLTDETSFDDSLETAFRIGLEQSRYVNVLSDLKTRETVRLMQRDPEHTKIDRAIGSEIAIRDGARALVLPTIAEIGGRVRVTAEIVDPGTQTTIWSESADGAGIDSVLASLDRVNQKLRVRLGEALATVSSESRPLDKVATKNLDALRAYSLGERAYDGRKYQDGLSFYRQALKLDPDFVLAHIGLARTLVIAGESRQAFDELASASASHDRASPRDALYVEAWRASLAGSQRTAIEKWKLLASLYPDFFAASGLYSYFSWQFANEYGDDVIEAAKRASSTRNPYAPTSQVLLGQLYLGNERYDEAQREFDAAKQGGLEWFVTYPLVDAVNRRFPAAEATLNKVASTGVPGADIDTHIPRIAIAVDRGRWAAAWTDVAASQKDAAAISDDQVRPFKSLELALLTATEPASEKTASGLRQHVTKLRDALAKTTDVDRADLQTDALLTAYLAARRGDTKLADEAIAIVGLDEASAAEFPLVSKALATAKAERARSSGHADEAVQILTPLLKGTELCVMHLALMDAHAAKGDAAAARTQAEWLATHRGRAYVEHNVPQMIPFNVAQSDLALLASAEFSASLGDKDRARKSLESFRLAWPDEAETGFLADRLRKLRMAL